MILLLIYDIITHKFQVPIIMTNLQRLRCRSSNYSCVVQHPSMTNLGTFRFIPIENRKINSDRFVAFTDNYVQLIQCGDETIDQKFRFLFVVSSTLIATLWVYVCSILVDKGQCLHLLLSLYFFEKRSTGVSNTALRKCDAKKFYKWTWMVVEAKSRPQLVIYQKVYYCQRVLNSI